MEIRELNLKHYGKFENHKITLKPGVNIIYGKNETGKTTIHSFIRAMFFGLTRGRGRGGKLNDYVLRQPWENPSHFAGSMRIEENGAVYRIDRNFDRAHQSLSMVCETRGCEAADGEAQIRELLNGMNEGAFCNTVFVRQARGETDQTLMEELQGFMVNYDSTMDLQTDISRALQSLRKKKKRFEQKKKADEQLLEEQIGRRQAEADYLRQELAQLREREKTQTGLSGQMEEQEELEADSRRFRVYRIVMEALLVLASLLCFAGAWLLKPLSIRIFLGIFGAVFLGCLVPVRMFIREPEEEEAFRGTDDRRPGGQEKLSAEEQQWRLQNTREEIRTREEKYQKLQHELEVLYQRHVKLEGVTIEIEALSLAIERITSLSSSILKENGGSLNEKASAILSQITGGKYTRISLDDSMDVRIQTRDRLLHLYEVSYGTMQQVYFSLRMAAGELFAQGRKLPLILDEPFAMYDDVRLEAVLRWLYGSGRQVILFSCQTRERRILEKIQKEEYYYD